MNSNALRPIGGEAIFDQGARTASDYKKGLLQGLVIFIVLFLILPFILVPIETWRWGASNPLLFYIFLTGMLLAGSIFSALGYTMIGQKWIVTDKAIYATNGGRYQWADIKKVTRYAQAVTKAGQILDFPNCRSKKELRQYMRNALETAQ